MVAEFNVIEPGEGPDEYPDVRGGWCSDMDEAIGQEVRISTIFINPDGIRITPLTTDPGIVECFNQYTWTLEMLELVDQQVLEHPEVSALLQMLGPPPASCINGPTARS